MGTKFTKSGNIWMPVRDEALDLHSKLPPGTYQVDADMIRGIHLASVDNLELPPKIYGDTISRAERILNTYQSRPSATGVLLTGEKGSGKTLLAKQLSVLGRKAGFPTILINKPFGEKLNPFIQSINQPCVIMLDEFEKNFDREEQQEMLTLLDGVFPSKTLFVLTCNDAAKIDRFMINRPGRIFYILEYDTLHVNAIREYCADNLKNTSEIERICQLSKLIGRFNFDQLKALVEEMNRYNESAMEALTMLNIKPDTYCVDTYDLVAKDAKGRLLKDCRPKEIEGNPMNQIEEMHVCGTVGKNTYVEMEFTGKDMEKIDPDRGIFILKNKKGSVTLTRRPVRKFSYSDYLS